MTNDEDCLLRRKKKQKRCFSRVKDKDGTRKTKSSVSKGERHLLNLCFCSRPFYYTEGEKKWNGGDDQWL